MVVSTFEVFIASFHGGLHGCNLVGSRNLFQLVINSFCILSLKVVMLSSFKAVVPIELMAVQMFFVSPSSFNVAGRRATEFVKAFCFACVSRRSADICAAWSRDATIANTLWIALAVMSIFVIKTSLSFRSITFAKSLNPSQTFKVVAKVDIQSPSDRDHVLTHTCGSVSRLPIIACYYSDLIWLILDSSSEYNQVYPTTGLGTISEDVQDWECWRNWPFYHLLCS